MLFEKTPVDGAFLISPEPRTDHRGFFARMYCEEIWKEHGLNPKITQCNASFTIKKGTIRGLHYQKDPHGEVKVIRCTKGRIFDVVADIRPSSPTYGTWFGAELTADNHRMMYVPEGCAHGFQTLEDDCEIFYLVSAPFNKDADSGVRFSDPTLNIQWPLPVSDISEKDTGLPFLA